MIAGRRKI